MNHTTPKAAKWPMLLTTILVTVSLLATFGALIDWYWSLPVVYVSAATKKCVRVEQIPLQKKRTCDDIQNDPRINYTTVWVK